MNLLSLQVASPSVETATAAVTDPLRLPERKRFPRLGCLVFATALGVAFQPDAFAQSGSAPVAARALFQQGRQLASEGRYEQACPAFEESQRLDPGIGTLFNWADCLEHLGKTASAWVRYLDVASAAKAAGQPDREKVARARAAALEANLSRLTVQVLADDTGLEVIRDDVVLGRVLWGTSVPVDLGTHVVMARAAGKRTWKSTIHIAANREHVAVVVPPLEAESPEQVRVPVVPAAPEPSAYHPITQKKPADSSAHDAGTAKPTRGEVEDLSSLGGVHPVDDAAVGDRRGGPSLQKILAYVTGGIGVAALLTGAMFVVDGTSKNNAAAAICEDHPTACPVNDIAARDDIVARVRNDRAASIVSFVLGGAALAGGTLLFTTAPSTAALSHGRFVGAAGRSTRAEKTGLLRSWHLQTVMGENAAGVWMTGGW